MSRAPNRYAYAFMLALVLLCGPEPAFAARTLGQMTGTLYDSIVRLQTFLSLLSYILGVFFSITSLQMFRDHVDDPGRNPINKALLRMAAAAFFIFTPTFANLLIDSIGGADGAGLPNYGGGTKGTVSDTDTGLDSALIRFVSDFAGPFMDYLLPFFAYAVGLIFMIVGLKRLALANGDGPQAPGGMGTIGTFFVAACMMAFGYFMGTIQGSIFGTTEVTNNPVFTGSADTSLMERANSAMWGVFIFLRIVGYISVLRGLFMLRGAAEGQQVSMMAVFTHMIAGAMLANGTAFVLAVQETFVKDSSMHILR